MAHKDVEQINTLLSLLDHPLIDIFLHLDLKSSIMQSGIMSPIHSHLYFVNRHDVRWGDISLVESEMELFKAVLDSKNEYDRIHLISAQDLPMKTIPYILEYFVKPENKDVEFLDYSENLDAIKRLQYYWFCTKHMRNGILYKIIRHSLLLLQKITHVNRLRNAPLVLNMVRNGGVSLIKLCIIWYLNIRSTKAYLNTLCVRMSYISKCYYGMANSASRKRETCAMQNLMVRLQS